ncbi:hypothetical protein BH10PSE12_BH10PSE12_19260 [soil metagenome]
MTGDGSGEGRRGAVFTCAYAPHSLLFPRVDLIVHHGGIGTTGQALRAGKPQLVVPHMGDQSDNARRIVRMGVGRQLAPRGFTTQGAASVLSTLMADEGLRSQARRVGKLISSEDGAAAAALVIARLVDARR